VPEVTYSGPHGSGTPEYEQVKKILEEEDESEGRRWQTILCRGDCLREDASDTTRLMETQGHAMNVFIAHVPSGDAHDECRFLLSVLVSRNYPDSVSIELLCSALKGAGVGGRLLDRAMTFFSSNEKIRVVELSPTEKAVPFYKKKGFDVFKYYSIFSGTDMVSQMLGESDRLFLDAVKRNEVELAETLLEKDGANPNAIIKEGDAAETPLHHAVRENHEAMADLLVKKEAFVNATLNDGPTPLSLAVSNGRFKTARMLLENGADPDERDRDGDTPLHTAVRAESRRMVKLLLSYGADQTIQNRKRQTARDMELKLSFKSLPTKQQKASKTARKSVPGVYLANFSKGN
tara:strand:- start:806 stop:1849 length:1044 start_codon:yes stop_codon:yes gene_type:complete